MLEFKKLKTMLPENIEKDPLLFKHDAFFNNPLRTRGIFGCPQKSKSLYTAPKEDSQQYDIICWGISQSRKGIIINTKVTKYFSSEHRRTHLAYVTIKSVKITLEDISYIIRTWPQDVWCQLTAEAIRIQKNTEARLKKAQEVIDIFYTQDMEFFASQKLSRDFKENIYRVYNKE